MLDSSVYANYRFFSNHPLKLMTHGMTALALERPCPDAGVDVRFRD